MKGLIYGDYLGKNGKTIGMFHIYALVHVAQLKVKYLLHKQDWKWQVEFSLQQSVLYPLYMHVKK